MTFSGPNRVHYEVDIDNDMTWQYKTYHHYRLFSLAFPLLHLHMSTKPIELRISIPEAFDGSYEKSMHWLYAVQFYLLVNKAVYNTNEKQIAFTLSYMTKGSALMWALTFHQSAISGTSFTL